MKIIPIFVLMFLVFPSVLGTVTFTSVSDAREYLDAKPEPPSMGIEGTVNITVDYLHFNAEQNAVTHRVSCVDFQIGLTDSDNHYELTEDNPWMHQRNFTGTDLDILFIRDSPDWNYMQANLLEADLNEDVFYNPQDTRKEVQLKLESGWIPNQGWCFSTTDTSLWDEPESTVRSTTIKAINQIGDVMFKILDDSVEYDTDIRISPFASIEDQTYNPESDQWSNVGQGVNE